MSDVPEIRDGTLFALPEGFVVQMLLPEMRCFLCGYWAEKIFLTVVAENNFQVHDGQWKRQWRHLLPCACGCSRYIWLPDDKIPDGFNLN